MHHAERLKKGVILRCETVQTWVGSLGSTKADRMKDPEETADWKAWSKPVGWAAGPWRFLFKRSKNMGRNVPTPPGVGFRGKRRGNGS